MTDPFAVFTRYSLSLSRATGGVSHGAPTRADEETILGHVEQGTKIVPNLQGDDLISTCQVACPASVGYVRPQSTVTLPAEFGGSTRTVIACQVADLGPVAAVYLWLE